MSIVLDIPKVPFPKKLSILFEPYSYKVVYGGRGGAKTESFSRALLIHGMQRRERILCLREVQHSIKDSVHQVLVDNIEKLKLRDFYRTTDTAIRGANGTTFSFAGLQSHTVDAVRSFQGATKVWVEEAHSVSKASWKVLIPTIRSEDREFWISFNPELDTGETYVRFVKNPPPKSIVVKMNWRDNPWFPQVLEEERQYAKATMDEEEYLNVWEGEPVRSIPGAIYAKQVAAMYAENRVTLVPYDPRLKVHVVMDLGYSDMNAVGFFQRRASEVRCIKTVGYQSDYTSEIAAELRKFNYNWGAVWLPHDGFSQGRHGASDDRVYRQFGFVVREVPDIPKEAGIRACREALRAFYFHEPDTGDGINGLKSYKRAKSQSGVIGTPVHDEASNWADMFRYCALSCRKFWNEADARPRIMAPFQVHDPVMGLLGG